MINETAIKKTLLLKVEFFCFGFFYKIKVSKKMKRFVIGDIHGCLSTLKALIEKIALSKNDQIYFLGDYIDKGKDGAGVVDFVMQLQQENYKVFALRGNHEENFLYAYKNYNPKTFVKFIRTINKSGDLLEDDGLPKQKYLNFFQKLDYFFELDNFWLVHGGFNVAQPEKCFTDTITMVEKKPAEYHEELLKGKTLIHGHQIHYLEKITTAIENKAKIIPLDNGCVHNVRHKIYDVTKIGQLACLELNSFELFLQKNIEEG